MSKTIRAILLVSLAGLTVAACSSSGSSQPATTTSGPRSTTITTEPTPTTLSVTQAGAQFTTAIAPANAALTAMDSALSALGTDPSATQAAAAVAPFVTALSTLQVQLTGIDWPSVAKADADTFITDVGALKGDLAATSGQNVFSAASWESQIGSDAGKLSAADGILRHDLGLPAATPTV